MKKEIKQVKKYISAAIEVMQVKKEGVIQEDLSNLPGELAKELMPMIIEVAKMIQIEVKRKTTRKV